MSEQELPRPAKVTIAFLIRMLNDGGAQRQLCELVRAMDKTRFRVCVVAMYEGGRFKAEIESIPDVELITIGKRHTWDVVGALLRLVREMKRIRPQILHGYLDLGNVLSVFLKPFLPNVKVVWGLRNAGIQLKKESRAGKILAELERRLSRYPDLFVANSNAGQTYHVSIGYPEDRFIVIQNGTNTLKFAPDPLARQQMREAWGVLPDSPLIGIAGRIAPEKDHITFLKAAGEVNNHRSECRYCIIGGGDEEDVAKLKLLAESLGIAEKVIWTGSFSEMNRAYNALDLLALTSQSEGFPNVVGEAMATGVPVVVTDVGDVRTLVNNTNVICPPGDASRVAATMLNVLASLSYPPPDLRLREQIEQNFSLDALRRKTEEALWKII